MAVYTKINRDDIEKILSHYNLSLKNYHLIKNGILNTNYFIDTSSEKFVLRIFESGRSFEVENQELDFLLEIKDIIPCCVPFRTRDNKNYLIYRDKMIALFYFIPGQAISDVTESYIGLIGEYLGKLHSYSKDKILERTSLIDMERYYKNIDFSKVAIPCEDKNIIIKTYEEVKNYDFSNLPRGIIHNDIFPDNVLVEKGKISGILDFNESKTAPFIYDIAMVINFWIRTKKITKEEEKRYTQIFIDEYEKYRKIQEVEYKFLDMALKKTALTFILLRLDKFINHNLDGIYIENKNYKDLIPLLYYFK